LCKKKVYEWISTQKLIQDSITLAGMLPSNVSGIAGVPRSGMLPASTIATHLHLPLYQLTEELKLERLGHGSRGRDGLHKANGPICAIDDTVYSGAAMTRLKNFSGLKCAVYVRPEASHHVDLFVRELPDPHLLEWNLFNCGPFGGYSADQTIFGSGIASDFDGIFCHDAQSGGVVGSPYLLPRTHPCRLIVTGRRESSRSVTVDWLKRNGCLWDRLEMMANYGPDDVEAMARHKARHYGESKCGFFVESCPIQSQMIFNLTSKPVICPAQGKVYQKEQPA
jgi:hypothetical protein